ncbi:MAG TPA: hypothetical protein VIW68_10675 [Candidatus Sulfotelmatobacter sp.]
MDSRQRQKASQQLVKMFSDPEVRKLASSILDTGEPNLRELREREIAVGEGKFARNDVVLWCLAGALGLVVFMVPRNPLMVIAGSATFLLCVLHPAWYMPVVMKVEGRKRKIRRALSVFAAVLASLAICLISMYYTVDERNATVSTNLSSSWRMTDPADALSTVFSVTNHGGIEIVSESVKCTVNDGITTSANVLRNNSQEFSTAKTVIKAGNDALSINCLKRLLWGQNSSMQCLDVTFDLDYEISQFPRAVGQKEYRYVLVPSHNSYEWIPIPLSNTRGECTNGIVKP